MILAPHQRPSNGVDLASEIISFTPLNFVEMVDYQRDYDKAKTEIDKYVCDIEMVKRKIPNWKTINLIDLDYIIFTIKRISISMTSGFTTEKTCKCGCVNSYYLEMSQVDKPQPLRTDIRGTINLGRRDVIFETPNLESFYKDLEKIHRFKKVSDLRMIKLISMFPEFKTNPNIIEDLVINAKNDDIIRLLILDQMYLDSKIELENKCKECKEGGMSMSINTLIDNVFLCLLLNGSDAETKINVG